jgi:beta-glucanase (GH16 family)
MSAMMVFFAACLKDNDGSNLVSNLPTLSIQDLEVTEGDTDDLLRIKVQLTGSNTTNAVTKWAVVSGNATADLDFTVISTGQLVFGQNETEKTLEIKLTGDEIRENTERFTVKLFNPINCTIAKEVGTITILDDDNNSAGLVIPTTGFITPTSYAGYNLAWADEFNADTLNTQNWTYEAGGGGWGNNELQHYRSDNTSIVNGNLVITAKQQKFANSDYTSSRLVTKGKKSFKFGRIDIRAALPKGQGLWPALWMLGANIDAVSWPACGEIDIMELTGNLPNRVLSTVHYGANTSAHQFNSQSKYLTGTNDFHKEFHVFTLNWEADKMEFFVDNELVNTITPASLNNNAAYPFNKPFFFIFNVAVGGTLPGNPDGTTAFPQSMIVDYVRVFQK